MQGSFAYNTIGVPTSIRTLKGTTALLDIAYQNNDSRGNIKNRKDLVKSLEDNFTYDDLNRVITDVEYSDNGNITYKWDAGIYSYDENHPHAISRLSPSNGLGLSRTNLSVTYNSVRLPVEITESGKNLYTNLWSRKPSNKKVNIKKITRLYSRNIIVAPYEEIQKGSTTRKNYYIYVGGEIVAVYTEGASDAGMYYFHTDHLGSPWLITNAWVMKYNV